jgi:choline dehydrogenase-like flavoprotein
MAQETYDIITVGGGLGGSTLAKVMAERGARVLVLERERQFRDRVRGEVMVSWGVAEAQALGIYPLMHSASLNEDASQLRPTAFARSLRSSRSCLRKVFWCSSPTRPDFR